MSLRAVPRRLARHATNRCAEAACLSSPPRENPQRVGPLIEFPQFHPISFAQDKFLSIKSRSLEAHTKLRSDVLLRCADLCAQLQRQQERTEQPRSDATTLDETIGKEESTSSTTGTSSELPSHPLTPHQAEELLQLTKKVEDLVQYQGFVLTDELVWRMLHLCIQCGVPQLAVTEWLQKHVLGGKRGPPFPLFILEDLAAALRSSVLPRLPESSANLCCTSVLMATSSDRTEKGPSIAFEDGLAAGQRFMWYHHIHPGWLSSEETTAKDFRAAAAYTSHLFEQHVWPVWQALEAMNLTFADLRAMDVENVEEEEKGGDGKGDEEEAYVSPSRINGEEEHGRPTDWLPNVEAQTLAVRTTLMSVTPLYSFHVPPSSVKSSSIVDDTRNSSKSPKTVRNRANAVLCSEPPRFPTEAAAIVAPLRALLDTWLVLAQCAAEAKDTLLLKKLLRVVCLGFLVHRAPASPVGINKDAWCQYKTSANEQAKDEAHRRAAETQARAMVREFVNGSLSVIQYGLLCAEQDAALWQLHDTCALIFGVADVLRNLQGSRGKQRRHSTLTNDSKLHRMNAVVRAHPTSTEEEDGILQSALPYALLSCFARVHQAAGDAESASATDAAHAFVRDALSYPAKEGTEHPYAEAGLYIALVTGDEALLAQAVPPEAEANTSETPLLFLHSHALRSYRIAVKGLSTKQEGQYEEAPGDDDWHALTAAMQKEIQRATAGGSETDTPRAQLFETCLAVLALGLVTRQAKNVTTYVQRAQQYTTAPIAEERTEGADAHNEVHGAYHNVETMKERREVIEAVWEKLYDRTNTLIRDAQTEIGKLLDAFSSPESLDSCLSPSSLSTLAILARLGVYAEEDALASVSAVAVEGTASIDRAHPLSLSNTLDRVLAQMVRDTCTQLHSAMISSSTGATPTVKTSVVGNWVQWVLLTLMSRRAWTDVLEVLHALDCEASVESSAQASGNTNTLLCSATVDPSIFAALYARALEDGAASVCAFLRPRRERLFF